MTFRILKWMTMVIGQGPCEFSVLDLRSKQIPFSFSGHPPCRMTPSKSCDSDLTVGVSRCQLVESCPVVSQSSIDPTAKLWKPVFNVQDGY